jgi:predicted TIM-barrel fold metal-dependent hydrolase
MTPAAADMICDSHIHVYGSRAVYPVHDESRYAWYDAPLARYQEFARRVGVRRIVIVQPSIYGHDNRCTVDAAQSLGANGRAVVEFDEATIRDEDLADMHARGARGVRVGVTLAQKPDIDVLQRTIRKVKATASRVAHLSWHVEVMAPAWLTGALFPALADLPVHHCLGHLGGMKASDRQTGDFDRMLAYLQGAGRRCFVKLSAFYRMSNDPRFDDLVPLVRDLIAVAPERMLWGTDFPHPRFADRVRPDSQLELIDRTVDDARLRRRILIDNPAQFYGFETASVTKADQQEHAAI